MPDCTVLRIDEMERAFGGAFVRARASLGVTSFGLQIIDLPPNSGDTAPEHDHLHDGQEEVYLLLEGDGEIEVDGQRHPPGRDVLIRVGAGARRRLRSGKNGMRIIAVGAIPGRPYVAQSNSELGGRRSCSLPRSRHSSTERSGDHSTTITRGSGGSA